jgi:hypothetical protein
MDEGQMERFMPVVSSVGLILCWLGAALAGNIRMNWCLGLGAYGMAELQRLVIASCNELIVKVYINVENCCCGTNGPSHTFS